MKKIFKKNQVIVTMLAVLIAVAGYLNYVNKNQPAKEANNVTYDSVYSKDEQQNGKTDIESLDGEENETLEPGAAILTNGSTFNSFMVQARLDREQTRSKNKETLMEVINNEDVSQEEKEKAVSTMSDMTKKSELENTVETLLKAKGFSDIVVTIGDEQVDVIVSSQEVDDSKRAQIEDVIKRKTDVSVDKIVITPASEK